ncbi:MAG: hypothetical protein UZ14_CFX002003054 [Chloroflexi bacterium OLB14]|nr:MAG: hypothetical protein UZ14_CFX002003054 [Chloroflexi bacterium OLB14]
MFYSRIIKIIIAISVVALFTKPYPVSGQGGIVVENAGVVVTFGQSIKFTANIKSSLPIQQASLLFREVNEEVTRVEPLQVGENGAVSFVYDASQNAFAPFSWVLFWFQATLSDGVTYTSDPIKFQYFDDRFPWRQVSKVNITINWYAGDDAFGAAALDVAGAGILAMRDFIPISFDNPLDIYIYSNVSDLQSTLLASSNEWVGAHAHPELGVVLVAIPPGSNQRIEMETKIPHELTHVLLYRSLAGNYQRQPAWLIEGIASMAEGYANPDYARAMQIASEDDSLIPLTDLCASFPTDAGSAFLAYAQSQSFVTYIRDSFGTSGLSRLMGAYSEGFNCELGATQALGLPLSQLDQRWRETKIGQNVAGVALRNLLPFILLMMLVLIVPLWSAIDMLRQRRKNGKQ